MMNLGARTFEIPGVDWNPDTPSTQDIDIILVDGLLHNKHNNDDESPWRHSNENFWPKDWLLKKLRYARLLTIGNNLKSPLNWQQFSGKSDDISHSVQKARVHRKGPIFFLCHGMGVFLFLQAWQAMPESIKEEIMGVFCFGAPLVTNKLKDFKRAVKTCCAIELDLEDTRDIITKDLMTKLEGLADLIKALSCKVFTFFEEKPTKAFEKRWLKGSSQKLITQDLAKYEGGECIGLDVDHSTVSQPSHHEYSRYIEKPICEIAEELFKSRNQGGPNNQDDESQDAEGRDCRSEAHMKPVMKDIENTNQVIGSKPGNNVQGQDLPSTRPNTTDRIVPSVNNFDLGSSTAVHRPEIERPEKSLEMASAEPKAEGSTTDIPGSKQPCQANVDQSDQEPKSSLGLKRIEQSSEAVADELGHTQFAGSRNNEQQSSVELKNDVSVIPGRTSLQMDHNEMREEITVKPSFSNLPTAGRRGLVGFIGREKYLNTLQVALVPQLTDQFPDNPAAFAIIGIAGQGKTQTALKFAGRHKNSFAYVIWVHADHEHKIIQDLQDFALQIGLITTLSRDPLIDANRMCKWLEDSDQPFLIIFDNAEDPSLLNRFWPHNRQGSILVTARSPEFKTANVAGNGQYLEDLELEEALEMLQLGLPQFQWTRTDMREASSILKLVGCHPFGILVVISQINSAGCSLERYRAEYSLDNIFADSTNGNNLTGSYDKRLAELWSITIRKLDEQPRSLIEMLALLDVDSFQENLLHFDGTVAEVSDFINSPVRYLKALTNEGLIYSIETDAVIDKASTKSSKFRIFHMHRLTQASVLLGLTPASRYVAFQSASVLLLRAIYLLEANYPEYRALNRQYTEYYKHADALHNAYSEYELPRMPFQLAELLYKMSRLCYKKDMMGSGLKLCETGEKIIKHIKQQATVSQADIGHVLVELSYNHACIATELGDFETSLDKFQAALQEFERIKDIRGESSQTEAHWKTREQSIYGGIANSLDGLGKYEEAEMMFRQCLRIETEDDEFSPYEVNVCRSMLFENRMEKTEEAAKLLLDFLKRYTDKYGQDESRDYLPGHARYWLGNIRNEQGRFTDAFQLHIDALRIFEATYGSSHHRTGDLYYKLGWHFARLQQHEASIEKLRKALHIYNGSQNKMLRKREIARTRFKLGMVYFQNGEEAEGDEQLVKARELRREVLGSQYFHSEEEADYNNLVSKWSW